MHAIVPFSIHEFTSIRGAFDMMAPNKIPYVITKFAPPPRNLWIDATVLTLYSPTLLCAAVVYWLLLWTVDPEVPGSSPEWVPTMRLDRLHRAYPSLHPFGVVQWVPVLSNIKTATGCESNRQLQLWTVFAGTVVNSYQFNGIQGLARQLCQIRC